MWATIDLSAIERPVAVWRRLLTRRPTLWAGRAGAALAGLVVAASIAAPTARAYAALAVAGSLIVAMQVLWRQAARHREARLRQLAIANGFDYSPRQAWSQPSALVNRASNRTVVDGFVGRAAGETVRIGTLNFGVERAGVGVNENWGFVSRTVPGSALPHIVLLSRDARARSLPATLDSRQKLLLEGDFQTYFDVYCTPGAEREALYILTPDLMARLADDAGFSSLEIIDHSVVFFTPGRFDPEDPAQWRRLQALLHSVGDDAIKRVRRFTGVDRAVPNMGEPPSNAAARATLVMSTGRSNRSTWVVETACAAIVAAAIVWAATR